MIFSSFFYFPHTFSLFFQITCCSYHFCIEILQLNYIFLLFLMQELKLVLFVVKLLL